MSAQTDKSVLQTIVAHKREEVAARKQALGLDKLMQHVTPCEPGQLENAFRNPTPATKLMLEIKPASPSAGVLAAQPDLTNLLEAYNQYGVAISVLTDEKYFGGSLALLSEVAQQSTCPVLCKEFIVDAYQLYEARQAGASAALLIVKALEDSHLAELTQTARSLGLTPLIEIQDEAELERSLTVDPTVLLINNRNLDTLEMDMTTTARLSPLIPSDILRISASGIENRADIERLQPFCDGFLIGSALMRQPADQLAGKLKELTGA